MSDADECDDIVFRFGDTYYVAALRKADAESRVAADREAMPGFVCDWHYAAGRAVFKRIARDRYARLAAGEQERAGPALQDWRASHCSKCGCHFDRHEVGPCRDCGCAGDSPPPANDPETGLAACPFCGNTESSGKQHDLRRRPLTKFIAECHVCGARTRQCDTPEEAAYLWNRRAALARPDAQPCEWCARGLCEKHGNNEEDRPDAGEDGASLALRRAAVDLRKLASDWRGQEDFVCGLLRAANEVMARSGLHGGAWTPEEMHEVEDYAARKGAEENGR
jgi:hypothetical protein